MLPAINTTAKIHKKEVRQTQDGKNIVQLNLSVGEKNTKKEFDNFYFKATFWEKSADFVDKYFNEGDFIMVKGDLMTETYTKQDGSKGSSVVLKYPKASFVPRGDNSQPQQQPAQQTPPQASVNPVPKNQQGTIPTIDVDDDSIPFAQIDKRL